LKLLADEGVDAAIVARLRLDGHDVLYIAEVAPGTTDNAVLELANGEERVLLTADKDFGELTFRLCHLAFGILLVRLPGLSLADKAHVVALAIDEHGDEMTRAFSVISPGLVRIRPRL
jgi:predicted nuclease of predicted toxin-antitoxin system